MKQQIPYLFILLLLLHAASCAQTNPLTAIPKTDTNQSANNFRLLHSIPGNYLYMNADVLDNIYLINTGNRLIKLNHKGDSVAVFNDVKKYGNPSYIDVSNPLKILVYYKNFSTVVVLDRLLVFRNSINLRKQQIFSVQAVATSYDNNIWVFDEQDFKLKKIDEDGKLLQESTDMRLLVDTVPSPSHLYDNENNVILYDKKRGFYMFDYYGALKNNLPFLQWENTAISRNTIYGFSENRLLSYELSSLTLKKYDLPPFIKDYDMIKAINGKLYLLKKDSVEIYSVQ